MLVMQIVIPDHVLHIAVLDDIFWKSCKLSFQIFFFAKFALNVFSDLFFLQIVAPDHSLHIMDVLDCVFQNLQIVVPVHFYRNFNCHLG